MLRLEEVGRLACPACRGELEFRGEAPEGMLAEGELGCAGCGASWPVRDGLCRLYREEAVRGTDQLMRYIYDGLPRLHDPSVRYLLPLMQSGTEAQLRDGYLPRLELEGLTPRPDGGPARILEVGIGCGANLPFVRKHLPAGLPVEIWGLDLSRGMVEVLRRRVRAVGDRELRLLLADAHALPFPDGAFDRVFHTGGIGGYRAPATALAEMARVARPGTPIVVVDEQLERGLELPLYQRLLFKLVTFYDSNPHCPVEHLPPGATDVRAEQVSRFFYCLRFRMPRGGVGRA